MTSTASVAPARPGGVLETPPARWRWLGVPVGAMTGTLSGATVASGVLPEALGILLLAVLVVTVPVAQSLAPRVAINSALLVGWVPLLWWPAWPVPINHAAVLVAVTVGCLTAWAFGGPAPTSRLRALLPQVSSSEAMIPLSAAVAWAATAPFSLAPTSFRALVAMLPGADNWAHFAMFNNIRLQGAIPRVSGGAPDGTPWAFEAYPRGFHTLAATLSEIGFPHMQAGAESIVAYAHAAGLVVVLGVVLVTSSILAVPGVSGRPTVAVPAVTLALTALLWEPGQKVLANGFASFWLGAAAAGSALVMATFKPLCATALQVVVIGGLLMCVATTWAPLLIVAAPAALMPLVRDRAHAVKIGRRAKIATTLLIVLVGAMTAIVLRDLLESVSLRFLVTEVSGFNGTSPLPTFVMLVVLLYGVGRCLVVRGNRALFSRMERSRLGLLLLALVLGVGSLTALLVAQLRLIGTTSYYFLKYLLGFELILACVAAGILAGVLVRLAPIPERPIRSWVAGTALAAAISQLFVPLWQQPWLLFSETDDGTAAIAAPYSRRPMAAGILDAIHHGAASGSFDTEYLPLGPGNALQLFYPDAWYHAAEGTVSAHVVDRMAILRTRANDVRAVAPLVRQVLGKDPRVAVLVPAESTTPLRALLPPDERSRVVPLRRD